MILTVCLFLFAEELLLVEMFVLLVRILRLYIYSALYPVLVIVSPLKNGRMLMPLQNNLSLGLTKLFCLYLLFIQWVHPSCTLGFLSHQFMKSVHSPSAEHKHQTLTACQTPLHLHPVHLYLQANKSLKSVQETLTLVPSPSIIFL